MGGGDARGPGERKTPTDESFRCARSLAELHVRSSYVAGTTPGFREGQRSRVCRHDLGSRMVFSCLSELCAGGLEAEPERGAQVEGTVARNGWRPEARSSSANQRGHARTGLSGQRLSSPLVVADGALQFSLGVGRRS